MSPGSPTECTIFDLSLSVTVCAGVQGGAIGCHPAKADAGRAIKRIKTAIVAKTGVGVRALHGQALEQAARRHHCDLGVIDSFDANVDVVHLRRVWSANEHVFASLPSTARRSAAAWGRHELRPAARAEAFQVVGWTGLGFGRFFVGRGLAKRQLKLHSSACAAS